MNLSYTCTQINNYPVMNENMQINSKVVTFVKAFLKKKATDFLFCFLVNCSVSVKGLIITAKS